MAEFQETPENLLRRATAALRSAKDARAAEAAWREFAGRQGVFRNRLKDIGRLPQAERARAGRALHDALARFGEMAKRRLKEFQRQEEAHALAHERLDITLPGEVVVRGSLHPLTRVRRDAERIFQSLGFSIAEGPEVETEWYNFDALNIPADHPARDLWDTFWLKSGSAPLLRTHTSPVQIRYMEKHQPPFRIIAPGQTYRYEATDASHDMQFWQIEGLMVDWRTSPTPVSMSTLVAVLTTFFEQYFRKPVAIRIRPSYFPFTEPSIEFDLSCIVCAGRGCSVCKETGWLEMGGGGMVHPKVFEAVRYNPKHVRGFAFGFGLDRLAMLKYRIPDIRLFRYGDLRFLKQFR